MTQSSIRHKSRNPLVVEYTKDGITYEIFVEYDVGDEGGFVVEIRDSQGNVVQKRKYLRNTEQVVKIIAEKLDAKIANHVVATLNSILGVAEGEYKQYEAETEHMVHPVGQLSNVYYFFTAEGWRKVELTESGDVFFDAAEVSAKFAPHIVNFLYHTPPSGAMDFSVLYETDALLEELVNMLSAYISARREYIQLAAVWSLLTYARHAFKFAEYLRIHKSGYGSGGTTAAKVISYFSARPLRQLVATTAAAFMRLVHVTKPTAVVDEVRDEELPQDMLNTIKLYIETAYDAEYLVARVVEGEVKDFSLYSNIIVVDTSFKFTTLSAERRAWTFRIERDASKRVDLDAALEDAKNTAPKLYAWGFAFSLKAQSYIRKYRNMQGLGALEALYEFMTMANMDTSVVAAVRDLVAGQLNDAYESAVITDPVAKILSAVDEVVEEAVNIYRATGVAPEKWHIDDSGCLYIYLDTLRRMVAARFRRLHEITVHVEIDADQRTVETPRQSQWYRVDKDVEPYLDLRKFLSILKVRHKISYAGRNAVLTVCP